MLRKLFRTAVLSALAALALSTAALAADAPGVLVNGEPVEFTDAVPQIVEGRTYIPLRAVFNALGFADADITWDGPTRTATAVKGGLTVQLTEGQNLVTVTEGGETSVLETDAAAFLDSGRVLVPLRFVAQAAGCNVGWDPNDRIALIDDVPAILAANGETYDLMEAYMAYSRTFSEKKYAVDGGYTMEMDVDGEKVTVEGDYEMLMDGLAAEFSTNMAFSGVVGGEDFAAQLPDGVDMEMRFDMEEGTYYLLSDALLELTGMGVSGMWFKLDMAALLEQGQTGMDYAGLMQLSKEAQELGFEEYLTRYLSTMPLTDDAATAADVLDVLNALCADSAFRASGNAYTSTFSQDGAGVSLTIYRSGDTVTGYAMDMSVLEIMDITASMEGKDLLMTMTMGVPAEAGMALSLTMEMDGTYTETNRSPATEPPADAGVLDLMQLLQFQS